MKFNPSQLERYIRNGYILIPLHAWDKFTQLSSGGGKTKKRPDGKRPRDNDWPTKDYSDFPYREHMESGCNVGVRLRDTDLVIDVDPRNGGDESFEKLQRDLGIDLTEAPTVNTGSGGRHIYFRKPPDMLVRDSLNDDYPGVEFKSGNMGRQVVSAGSLHPDTGKTYEWDPFAPELDDLPEAPKKLLNLIKKPMSVASTGSGKFSIEQVTMLLDTLDTTLYDSNQPWLDLMMACHHASGGSARDEFVEWSTRDPEYSEASWHIGLRWDSCDASDDGGPKRTWRSLIHEVKKNGGTAGQVAIAQLGDSAQEDFDHLIPEGEDNVEGLPKHEQPNPLEAMNRRFCMVEDGSTFRVYQEKTFPSIGGMPPRKEGMWMKKQDFRDILQKRTIPVGPKNIDKPLADVWMKWKPARMYKGVIFDPQCDHEGWLNTWTGWGVDPKKGEWGRMEELVFEGLSSGDRRFHEYLMDWMAYMVQTPWLPAEVAICFRGDKGVGKSTLGQFLVQMAGRHGLSVSSPRQVYGDYNGHLRNVIMLMADEAISPYGKEENKLKDLITARSMSYEQKFKNIEPGANMLHLMLASNHDFFVKMSHDERRFAVSEASPKYQGRTSFWNSLHREMSGGGLQAMMWDLMSRDVEGWHPRENLPNTTAAIDQKLQGLDPIAAWWYEHLYTGDPFVYESELCPNADGSWGDWGDGMGLRIYKDDMRKSFYRFCKDRDIRAAASGRGSSHAFTKAIKRICPLYQSNVQIKAPNDRMDIKAKRGGWASGVQVPTLDELRADFERHIGGKIDWTPV